MPTQSFDDLRRALRKGEFPRALYLHGEEDVLKTELIADLIEKAVDPSLRDFNLDVRSAGSLDAEAAETLCNTLPMMADRRVVVIKDTESWIKRAKAKGAILRYLEKPAAETVLVLVQGSGEDKPDPDLAAKSVTVEAATLPAERAQRWLLHHAERLGVGFEPEAAAHMVKVAESNLGVLRSELDKLAGLGGGPPLTRERVGEFLGVRHGETPADWIANVLRGEVGRAAELLPHLLAQTGVSGVQLVAQLGVNVAALGFGRSAFERGTRGGALAGALKQMCFRLRPLVKVSYDEASQLWSQAMPQWPARRIEAAFGALRRADERLKNTAISDEHAILFDLCMELTLPWQRAA